MIKIGIIIVLAWGIIFPFTDWYVRFISRKTIRKGPGTESKVCLSFDDGPDPRYTPEILKILREMQIPATFFLVGAKAERSPELVKRIVSEGHQIGCHTYDHRHAYLLSPWKSVATIREGRMAIERITEKSLCWFRPPWGSLNLFQYRYLKHLGLPVVLWNANARDWKKDTGDSGIFKLLVRRVKPNSIIVLHDSGGESGAPDNTIAALPNIIKWLQNNGYTFVTLEELWEGK